MTPTATIEEVIEYIEYETRRLCDLKAQAIERGSTVTVIAGLDAQIHALWKVKETIERPVSAWKAKPRKEES